MLKIIDLYSKFMKFGPVSLKVLPKEIIGIKGESGSGKSLLLKAVSDMIEHDGKVFLNDREQQDFTPCEWRKKVGLLPAEIFFWNRQVKSDLQNTDPKLLEKFGFNPSTILNKNTDELSSGEKQRIGLLRLLENNPKVLLLDEPSANLDEKNKIILEEVIVDYLNTTHSCAIWVGHDSYQLERTCSKVIKIKNNQFGEN